MNGFNIVETLTSIISAFSYGVLFSFFTFLLRLKSIVSESFKHSAVGYEITEKNTKIDAISKSLSLSSLEIFLSVILFGLGFVTLSYVSLDGYIRLYTLVFALLGLYVANILFVKILSYTLMRVLVYTFRCIRICKKSIHEAIHREISSFKQSKNKR
jgi:hypothetical protein